MRKSRTQVDRGCHWQILYNGGRSQIPRHDWVEQHRDYILNVVPANTERIRWADAEDTDDEDQPPSTGRGSAKGSGKAVTLVARSRTPTQRGSSSMPGGARAPPAGLPRPPSPPADLQRLSFVRANATSFAANALRTVAIPPAATAPPSKIYKLGRQELWLGSVLDLCCDGCEPVKQYSVVVDCMGGVHHRPWEREAFANTALIECAWNHERGREHHLVTMLNWLIANIMHDHERHKIIVICKKGERRSAAVIAMMLICLYDFTLNAAAAQICDRRPSAKLTTARDGNYEATYTQVEQVMQAVKEGLEWI